MSISEGRSKREAETETADNENQIDWKVVEQILLEARIVARWARKPFYIS